MKVLQNASVLLLSAAPEQLDLAAVWLRSEGARLHVGGWASAEQDLRRLEPAVVVMDLRASVAEGQAVLARMRAEPALARTPAVALVDRTQSSAALEPSAGPRFNKYIAAPVHPADLVSALVGLLPASSAESGPDAARESVVTDARPRSEVLGGFLKARAERKDMRGLLQLLNATGPFRFTSILRFDGENLASVWTFDREAPDADSFPIDKTVAQSYCSLVRESDATVSIPDVALVPSLQQHPARHSVLSYCGVPLRREDASLYGTLCHFDVAPRLFADSTVKRLEETAVLLRAHLPADDAPLQA
jgi:CheY-like chemotaxis protein